MKERVKSNIQKLVKEYPDLFPPDFRIDCGDGWTELVRLTCKYFQQLIEKHQEVVFIKFVQIKEKFGFLRIYFDLKFLDKTKATNNGFNEIHHFVFAIENVSGLVCEDCGKIKNKKFNVETRRTRGHWIRTVCDKCYAKDKR